MATDREDQAVKDAAADLKHTPYALTYISSPTPTTTHYVFQQEVVALSPAEARTHIAESLEKLRSGKAEWSSGVPYGENPLDTVPELWAPLYRPTK